MIIGPAKGPFGLSEAQIERYARHLILPEVGGRGQRLLLDARVSLAGHGDAAEEAALFLAAAGVVHLELDGALIERVGPRLLALNPETDLRERNDDIDTQVDVSGASRLHGAMNALQTICAIVSVGPDGPWVGLELLPGE